ncbi:type II toxin-antitoxin system HicB family antitoxin [Taklimakanibacter lacteus]|uniref:type II toxin-antitoxin system HicB family antitoxin n=1 Tax=Taklimakanibacter lacteus TaxID=2268456 RepID=UPI000E6610C0
MLRYPVILKKDSNDTLLVTAPDFPELVTFGENKAEALARAVDALATVIQGRISDREKIPKPSKAKRGQFYVNFSTLIAAKLALYDLMIKTETRKADLARKLGVHAPQIDRLLDLDHDSRLDQIDSAVRALGKELEIRIVEAA